MTTALSTVRPEPRHSCHSERIRIASPRSPTSAPERRISAYRLMSSALAGGLAHRRAVQPEAAGFNPQSRIHPHA